MLAGVHRRGGLLRMKIRWTFNDNGIQLLVQQFAIGGETGITLTRVHFELFPGGVCVLGKIVRNGDEVIPPVFLKEVGNPFPTASASDEPDVDFGAGVRASNQARVERGERRDRSAGSGQKTPASH